MRSHKLSECLQQNSEQVVITNLPPLCSKIYSGNVAAASVAVFSGRCSWPTRPHFTGELVESAASRVSQP